VLIFLPAFINSAHLFLHVLVTLLFVVQDSDPHILAESDGRRDKEAALRRKKLARLL
jgi:hypothetical protein